MHNERYLTKPHQYALIYSKGRSSVTDLLVMRVLPNGLALSRCSFSVGKRLGNAVTRNKVKRRLRETWRVMPLKPGWDIVFIARPAAAKADFNGLRATFENLLSQADLLETEESELLAIDNSGTGDNGNVTASEI